MKVLPWILVGVGTGVIAFFALNQPAPRYATGNDDVEDAAVRTSLWGSRQRVAGAGHDLLGKAKRGFGEITCNDDLAAEGAAEQVVGVVKDAAGQSARAIGQTIHDLNR